MRAKIEAERRHKTDFEKLKLQLEENLPYLKEKFLNELLQGRIGEEETAKRMAFFGIAQNPASDLFEVSAVEVSGSAAGTEEGEGGRMDPAGDTRP